MRKIKKTTIGKIWRLLLAAIFFCMSFPAVTFALIHDAVSHPHPHTHQISIKQTKVVLVHEDAHPEEHSHKKDHHQNHEIDKKVTFLNSVKKITAKHRLYILPTTAELTNFQVTLNSENNFYSKTSWDHTQQQRTIRSTCLQV